MKKAVALLELSGPFATEDIALKNTFEFYWKNSKKWGLNFRKFPIYDTQGDINNNIAFLNKLYSCGYRIFIGFSRSSMLTLVLDWFNKHPDAVGISATSTAFSLAVKKNVYRMTPIDKGIQINLENNILKNPSLSVYFMYQEGDFFSTDYLHSFQQNPIIAPRLVVCSFSGSITQSQLSNYLKDSKTTDFIINGLVDIDFLSVFNTPNYTVKPYIYDSIGSKHPVFTPIQANNLHGKYSYFSYQGVNTSYLWRIGLRVNTINNYSPIGYDILQVQTQLAKGLNPNYLSGSAGILQFDKITKDRLFYSVSREDFTNLKKWIINSLIFNDPIYGQFISTKA